MTYQKRIILVVPLALFLNTSEAASRQNAGDMNSLEVIVAHILILISMHASDASLCCFLAWVDVLGECFAVEEAVLSVAGDQNTRRVCFKTIGQR